MCASSGGPATERELFELVYRRMRSLAAGTPDFDDLVQAAAEQVFRSLPSFDGRSELETWVYAVCYRVMLAQRRWYWRFKRRFSLDWGEPALELGLRDESPTPDQRIESRQRLEVLNRALARMSDKYRAVLVLYYLEDFETAQIAAIVGSNELTVRSRLRDARKQLLKLLGKDAALICEETAT